MTQTNRSCTRARNSLLIRGKGPSTGSRSPHLQTYPLFWRYGLIGAFATGAHYALLLALVEGAHAPPGPAAMLAAGGGAVLAYLGNRRYTFASAEPHRRALPRFLLVAAFGAVANGLLVWGATAAWGWHYLAAQAVATATVLFATFLLNRHWALA